MKINKVDILITKVELKKNSKGEAYLLIGILDIDGGDNFQIMAKDLELMSKLKPMTKYKVNLLISSNKYGIMMEIENILEEIGVL